MDLFFQRQGPPLVKQPTIGYSQQGKFHIVRFAGFLP
jgi:hypothetical protein